MMLAVTASLMGLLGLLNTFLGVSESGTTRSILLRTNSFLTQLPANALEKEEEGGTSIWASVTTRDSWKKHKILEPALT